MIKCGGTSLPKRTWVGNRNYPSLVTINARGKDRTPNGLGDEFPDLWFDDLVQGQAIRALFLLESNHGFDRCLLHSSLLACELTKESPSPLSRLLEQGLFEPERGEGQCQGRLSSHLQTSAVTDVCTLPHRLLTWHGSRPKRTKGLLEVSSVWVRVRWK